jgi:hypothetical protein
VGTLSVNVNDQPAKKVNIHSSGALSGSFLNAIIDIRVPKGAKLYISIDSTDVAINIDQIIIGNGDLDLPLIFGTYQLYQLLKVSIRQIGKVLAKYTPFLSGGAKPSLVPGRTGTLNPCLNKVIGMRVVCIWREIHNMSSILKILAIPLIMAIKTFATTG